MSGFMSLTEVVPCLYITINSIVLSNLLGPVDSHVFSTSKANQHRDFTSWSKGKLVTLSGVQTVALSCIWSSSPV